MDALEFFINLGTGAKELQKPMTLEEAIDILDPSVVRKQPEDKCTAYAREIKAKMIAVKYIRNKLKQEEALNDGKT